MRRILEIILILSILLLAACGSEESSNGDNNPNPEAPYFNPVGTLVVTAGQTLDYSIVANDPNDMNITLTFDGTLGPNANPFDAGASFDPVSGLLTWNTDAGDIGNYSVRITATNDAVPTLATSINISISVIAAVGLGESLYDQHCISCHEVNSMLCRDSNDINGALGLDDSGTDVGAMSGIAGRLSDPVADVNALVEYLGQVNPALCL